MNETSEFGNTSWHFYVTASYLIVALALALFTYLSIRMRRTSLQKLKEEGFFSDPIEDTTSQKN